MMTAKICICCSAPFIVRPQSPDQQFCAAPICQKERRKRWRQKKMATDSDYRHNQSQAQRAWLARNPNYWREYRKAQNDTQQNGRPIRNYLQQQRRLI